MPTNPTFPPTVEIKRAIAAVRRAGIEIGSIEIQPRKIIIYSRDPTDNRTDAEIAYEEWKAIDAERARCALSDDDLESDALPRKPR